MTIVLNDYFVEPVLSGRKKTFATQFKVKPGERVYLATEKENTLIGYATCRVLHALDMQVFYKTKKIVLAGLVLSREESLEIIKNEGFEKEAQFWDAFRGNISCILVRFDDMRPMPVITQQIPTPKKTRLN